MNIRPSADQVSPEEIILKTKPVSTRVTGWTAQVSVGEGSSETTTIVEVGSISGLIAATAHKKRQAA